VIYFAASNSDSKRGMVLLDKIKKILDTDNTSFFNTQSKCKLQENSCARSIQIPANRSKTAMSKCPLFPVARSIGTYGPLDKEDTGGQRILPTGSLPATLHGATVCTLVFF
jgi:hypothetical protein